jgi:hypothetical protein
VPGNLSSGAGRQPEPRSGIFAVAGVRDGGGNIAHGNGDPRECLNVVCG